MTHAFIHQTIAASMPFIVALFAAVAVWTAAGLSSSASGRISPASRHLILSIALLAGPATGVLAMTPAAGAIRALILAPAAAASIAVGAPIALAPSGAAPAQQSEVGCVLLAIWAAGVVLLLVLRSRQWAAWDRVARQAAPVRGGELFAAFTKASCGTTASLAISSTATEPMVVGVICPVVLLPERYAHTLHEDEIATVFAHEIEHLRRRDNVTAAVHEVIAAIFWFDPLHWMARRRLLELRERACDQRVLDLGSTARAYAAALAKTCHAAIETSAVSCMSGFHVRERIDLIMNYASDRPRFVRDRVVRMTTLLAMGLLLLASALVLPPPSLAASGDQTGREPYQFKVQARAIDESRVFVSATVIAGDERPAADGSMKALFGMSTTTKIGVPAGASSEGPGRTFHIRVTPDKGNAVATLTVKDGETVIYRTRQTVPIMQTPASTSDPATRELELRATHLSRDMKPPQLLSRVEPLYPPAAKAAGIQGIVIVEAVIDETGVVRSTKVLKPMPDGLSEAAEAAVKQWVFAPAMLDNKPVPVIFNVTINFKLK